jgi:hypothetical protein
LGCCPQRFNQQYFDEACDHQLASWTTLDGFFTIEAHESGKTLDAADMYVSR